MVEKHEVGSQAKVTDQMLKVVLDEVFNELDTDRSGTLELNELKEYAMKMQKKLRPKQQFSEKLFESNFYRMDTYSTGWVNKDTLFRYIVQKAIASGAIDLENISDMKAVEIPDRVDY